MSLVSKVDIAIPKATVIRSGKCLFSRPARVILSLDHRLLVEFRVTQEAH